MAEIVQVKNGFQVIYKGRISVKFDSILDAIRYSYKMKRLYL